MKRETATGERPGAAPESAIRVQAGSKLMFYEQDGGTEKASYSSFRGDHANFHPQDRSLQSEHAISRYFMRGLAPAEPFLDRSSSVVAFGSCFAGHISNYLSDRDYNLATKRGTAYVSTMGDGIVNTFAIRQQFEWAWEHKQPQVELWHGYDAKALGYDETVRVETEAMFSSADVFIITLGLSEVWYDEPTKEVFWRAVPKESFDPSRHRFRLSSHQENLENLRAIHRLIRKHRPEATVILTLSPIPLTATFRPVGCVVANSVSKSILRVALDEFFRETSDDGRLFYFPSFEIAQHAFEHPWMEDRRHIHKHVLDFNMAVFERFFCKADITDADIAARYAAARRLDQLVARDGHWAVPRGNLLFREPPPGAKVWSPNEPISSPAN